MSERMDVAIVGIVGLPALYGGFETLAENLIAADSDFTYLVFCSAKMYGNKPGNYKNAKMLYIPLDANGPQSILYDFFSLFSCIFLRPKVVLVLGVSGGIFLPLYRWLSRSRILVNIDGMEWRRQKWNGIAKWFLKKSESIAVRYAHEVIADNKAIMSYIENRYNRHAHLIAYGGDHAIMGDVPREDDEGYALSICRIEPENNCHIILEAFSCLDTKFKFVGNWDVSDYGRSLKEKYSKFNNIEIINPIYDIKKLFDLRIKCSIYIHGHSAGGTNPSLVEMMHFGKPIVAFDCVYNRETMENEGVYFENSKSLELLLRNGFASINCDKIKYIAESRYSWSMIRSKYYRLFCAS